MTNRMIHTPEGVRDIYGKELKDKLKITSLLHEVIHSYGYHDIETPTFEYFDVFANEVGPTPGKDLYKFFDNEGNTMALRPDFTPSIARCAAKYFVDESMPVRLCYEGKSFANKSDLQGKLKESTQMGVELIDSISSIDADAEMVCLVIEALKSIGLEDFQIAIGDIAYFKSICESINLSDDDFDTLKEYVEVRNYFGAREFLENHKVDDSIIDSLLEVSDITQVSELSAIKTKVNNDIAIKAIERLENIYEIIKSLGFEKYVSFDLGMINKYHYYSGIIFRAYTYGVGASIVKGGRYDNLISKFGKDSSAVGLVFLIDDIMTALKMQKLLPKDNNNEVYVVYSKENRQKAFSKMRELRENGIVASGFLIDENKTKEAYTEYAKKNNISDIQFFI